MAVAPLKHIWWRWAVTVLLVAAAYSIAGRLSLLLAIPPGYATALWPPAGIALAGLLLGGTRMWPGIWLGSFMVNIGTAFDASDAAALFTSIVIPTSIGVGATLQALVGAALVRRYVGFPNALTRAPAIGAFLTLGGPVSCLIGASVGVTTLALTGQIPGTMCAITWGTWRVGDTLGVFIVTPLVLIWLAEPRDIWRRRQLLVALPLVGALSVACLIFGYTRAQEWERTRLLFERQAESLARTLQMRFDDYLDVLHACASLYTSTPEVSRQAFHAFVQRSLVRHPGLQALSWDLRLPAAVEGEH